MSDVTIIEFLQARIAEEEAEANVAKAEFAHAGYGCYGPARVLAECAAKRELIEIWHDEHGGGSVLKPLAAIYKDHPEFQEEWA